ncbi:DUF2085 domain-containing protein [Chloroflexota bacterium]
MIILPVVLLFLGWLLNTPDGLLGKADAVGYAVCHRIDARSFHLGDRAVPLCARCSGMYLGAMLGLAYQAFVSRRRGGMPPVRVILVLGLFVVAFGVDGVNSYLRLNVEMGLLSSAPTLYDPQNLLRLLTGTGMGLGIAAMIYPAFSQTVWADWQPKPAIAGLRSLGMLILLALFVDLLVLTENPLLLYPLALVSAAGVLILLTMVYSMVWMMLFRLENRYQALRQMILPLMGGFGLALLQIVLLDLVRYVFTGSWDGFHLG